jgi:hypothetical protein
VLLAGGASLAEHQFSGAHHWDESFIQRAARFIDERCSN